MNLTQIIKSVTYSQLVFVAELGFESLLPVFSLVCVPGLQPGNVNDF